MCQGLLTDSICGIVRGDAPQFDSTSSPTTCTWELFLDRKANFNGAMRLN